MSRIVKSSHIAAEADPESEWHQACFAGAFVLAQETMRRKQEVLH